MLISGGPRDMICQAHDGTNSPTRSYYDGGEFIAGTAGQPIYYGTTRSAQSPSPAPIASEARADPISRCSFGAAGNDR